MRQTEENCKIGRSFSTDSLLRSSATTRWSASSGFARGSAPGAIVETADRENVSRGMKEKGPIAAAGGEGETAMLARARRARGTRSVKGDG